MKKITIIRHAKSDWIYSAEISDIDRALKPRGVNDAYLIGNVLKEENHLPNLILSSNACRAMHTAVIIAKTIGFDAQKIQLDSSLYHASANTLLKALRQIDEQYNSVFLFAHNPGISDFVSAVDGLQYHHVATTGVAHINYNGSWNAIDFETMELQQLHKPKDYKTA